MAKTDSRLGDLVKGLISTLGSKERLSEEDIAGAWADAVGVKAAKHSRPVSLKKSSLVINVDGSGWLYELSTKKREILEKLAGGLKGKKIKDIRLRIGDIK